MIGWGDFREIGDKTIAAVEGRAATVRALRESSGNVTDAILELLDGTPPMEAALSDELLAEFRSEPSARGLAFLALTGRQEILPEIVEILRAHVEDTLAAAAEDLLQYLVTESTPVADILRLGVDDYDDTTLSLLSKIETPDALDEIENHIRARRPEHGRSYSLRVAAYHAPEHRRTALAQIVWEAMKSTTRFFWEHDSFYRAIGLVEDDDAEELLTNRAFGTDNRAPSGSAIQGLAFRNPNRAFLAAERILKRTGKERSWIVDLLFEIDAPRALDLAIDHMPHERNVLVRSRIGRMVRQFEPQDAARMKVLNLLKIDDARIQSAGCDLAGWIPSFETELLRDHALRHFDPMVRSLAKWSLRMHADHERMQVLLAEFEEAVSAKAWALMQTLVDTGQPLLVLSPGDVLSIGPRLVNKPAALAVYAQERAEERWKKYVDSTDRDMRDDFYR